jgi:hypothetical protein
MEYKQTDVTGAAWQRCHQIVIDNPLNATPLIRFDEQRIVTAAGAASTTPLGSLTAPFDPAAEIPLIDPQMGEPTGETVTHGALYAALYSAYMQQALARDAAATPDPEEASDATDD